MSSPLSTSSIPTTPTSNWVTLTSQINAFIEKLNDMKNVIFLALIIANVWSICYSAYEWKGWINTASIITSAIFILICIGIIINDAINETIK